MIRGKNNNGDFEKEKEETKREIKDKGRETFKKNVKIFLLLTGISAAFIVGGFIYAYVAAKKVDKKYNKGD